MKLITWFRGQRNCRKKWENNPYYICAFDGPKYLSITGSEKTRDQEKC